MSATKLNRPFHSPCRSISESRNKVFIALTQTLLGDIPMKLDVDKKSPIVVSQTPKPYHNQTIKPTQYA